MNIHIIPHGRDTNHIKTGLRAYDSVDKVYLLTSKKFLTKSKELNYTLEDFGYTVENREIDAFNLRNVVDALMDIARKHKSDNLFINITGGTNLMAGAATSTAFFIGAKAYYVMEKTKENESNSDLVKELPIPSQPLYIEIKGLKRQILEKLWEMDKEGKTRNMQYLCKKLDVYPQKISFHIADLERKNLVKTHKIGRETELEITPVGKLYLRWTT